MPSVRRRLAASVAVGLVAALLCAWIWSGLQPGQAPDITQQWIAARAILAGGDPYHAVPAAGFRYPYLYPLPAALIFLPLALLPLEIARAAFIGLGIGCLAFALTARGGWPLLWLASGAVLSALKNGQWAPLFVGAIAVPSLRWLWLAKPTVGLAYLAGWGVGRVAIGIGLALLALACLVQPDWPFRWYAATTQVAHVVPLVLRPGGVLLLLALLRWRQPEARFLAVFALVPQTPSLYEAVPLGLIPQTRRAMMLLVATTQLATVLGPAGDPARIVENGVRYWPMALALIYLPALAILLWPPARVRVPAPA